MLLFCKVLIVIAEVLRHIAETPLYFVKALLMNIQDCQKHIKNDLDSVDRWHKLKKVKCEKISVENDKSDDVQFGQSVSFRETIKENQ